MISESVNMILEYTLFPSFSHWTEANVIWILTVWGGNLLYSKFKWYKKNMPDSCLEYQELPPLL